MQSQIKDLCINRFQLENLFEQVMSFINVNKDKKPHVQNEISDEAKELDRVPNVGVRGRFPGRRKQEAVIA